MTMTDEDGRMELAVQLVLAMMRSASTDKIRPIDWWERARSALETGAATAETFPQLVAVMGRKLQIDATVEDSSKAICSLAETLLASGDFGKFRHLCETQALYVVAIAQARRAEQRAAHAQR